MSSITATDHSSPNCVVGYGLEIRTHTQKKITAKSWRPQKHGFISLLASESSLAVFVTDVSHDKKFILCLHGNMSLLFSNLSTLDTVFENINFLSMDTLA